MDEGSDARARPPLDWDAARASLRRQLSGRLDPHERSELDDLVQEGCVRLLRASRRTAVDDLEGLSAVIARRTFQSWLRRRYRHERRWKPLDEALGIADGDSRDPRFGDLVERIEFVVLELFRREGRTECEELARAFLAERSWKQFAERSGSSHVAVRKRWSRCLELPRSQLTADPRFAPYFRSFENG